MDNFLVGLYEEEKTKIAAADLGNFMGTLPVDELEEFLGLAKVAVAGSAEVPYPDSEKGQLAKDQKKADGEVAKIQGQPSPERVEEKTAGQLARIQKIAKKIEHRYQTGIVPLSPRRGAAKGAIAGGLTGLGLGGSGAMALRHQGFLSPRKAALVAAASTVGGALLGGGGGALTSSLKRGQTISDAREIAKINRTSAGKAKIAMRAMKVTEGAPLHVKQAAALFAGREIAKVAAKKLLDDPRYIDALASNVLDKGGRHHPKGHKLRKLRESNKGVAAMLGVGGALTGGGLGNALGRAYGGKKGALIGSGLGALGLGTLGVASSGRVADTNRRLYKSMDKQAR